jgi:hypothetical protein
MSIVQAPRANHAASLRHHRINLGLAIVNNAEPRFAILIIFVGVFLVIHPPYSPPSPLSCLSSSLLTPWFSASAA